METMQGIESVGSFTDECTAAPRHGQVRAAAGGYRSADYAQSLCHLGVPRALEASGGYVLERVIPDTRYTDALGPVPLFDCADWTALEADLQALSSVCVSLVLLATPFRDGDTAALRALFPAMAREYKRHYIVDLQGPWEAGVSRHHRYYARRALKTAAVARWTGDASPWSGPWIELYGQLARRHGITGVYDFPPQSLAAQLSVPGMQLYIARHNGAVTGMQLWLRDGTRAYHHLSSCTEEGYRQSVSYAMVFEALSDLARQGVQQVDLGAGAGHGGNGSAGLDAFKAGWTPHTRSAFLCGRVFDAHRYRELSAGRADSGYFPAYRAWPGA